MIEPPTRISACNDKALEIAMRNALGSIEELAISVGYEATPGTFEILAIEQPVDPAPAARRPACLAARRILSLGRRVAWQT